MTKQKPTQISKEEAWKEIIDWAREYTTQQPDEITIREFSQLIKKSNESAKWLLYNLEKEGKVTSRMIQLNGSQTRVFKKVQ